MLTDRWSPLRFHAEQHRAWTSDARFKVIPAGRRSGKTELAKRNLVMRAVLGSEFKGARYAALAPTHDQARRIFWDDLKAMVPDFLLAGRPHDTKMLMKLINGSEINVIGLDKPERIEGSPWDGIVIDEIANTKPGGWEANIRPALSDRRGWAWLIGVPEGMNHYYELAEMAKYTAGWDLFHWLSADILPPEEIAAARATMDELTFRQEYEASFVTFQGLVYYPFTSEDNVMPCRHRYNPDAPLYLALDFNVEPGTATVIQEYDHMTHVIGEIHIPRDSNTPRVCRKFIEVWGKHKSGVHVYGDATGGARGTAKVHGSDWDLVKAELRRAFPGRVTLHVPRSNPRERVRVNAVNARICAADGTRRLFVDPCCKRTIKDFRSVKVLAGSAGEIDKRSDSSISHLTDGLGYYIERRFPLRARGTESKELQL